MKTLTLVYLVLLGFILAGCYDESAQISTTPQREAQETPTPIEKTVAEPEIFKLGDEISAGQFKWKVISVKRFAQIGQSFGDTFMGVKANGEFLLLDVEVENIGKSAQLLSDSFLILIDDQGREFSADSTAAMYFPQGEALFFETLNPGVVKKGKIAFDVPKGLKIVNAKISDSLVESSFYTVKLIT